MSDGLYFEDLSVGQSPEGLLVRAYNSDGVLLDGRNSMEALSRMGRTLLRAGTLVWGELPDFRQLDAA